MQTKRKIISILTSTVVSTLLVAGAVFAVTTISTNIETGGNLTVSGTSSLSGNTTIGGTLGVTGATTLSSTLAVTGNTTLTGDLAVNGGDISTSAGALNITDGTNTLMTVTDGGTTGNVNVTGTLNSAGNFSVGTNKLTVAATSGNTAIAGTLEVTGAITATGGLTGAVDAGSATLEIANGTALPATCSVGQLFADTDSNDCADTAGGDGALCICKAANTWALIANY